MPSLDSLFDPVQSETIYIYSLGGVVQNVNPLEKLVISILSSFSKKNRCVCVGGGGEGEEGLTLSPSPCAVHVIITAMFAATNAVKHVSFQKQRLLSGQHPQDEQELRPVYKEIGLP